MNNNEYRKERTVEIPEGVILEFEEPYITLKKNKIQTRKKILKPFIKSTLNGTIFKMVVVKKKYYKFIVTAQKIIQSLLKGFEKPFEKRLQIFYSHFPMHLKHKIEDNIIEIINFLGSKQIFKIKMDPVISIEVTTENILIMRCHDLEILSNYAHKIQNFRRNTFWNKLDKRKFQDGIYILKNI